MGYFLAQVPTLFYILSAMKKKSKKTVKKSPKKAPKKTAQKQGITPAGDRVLIKRVEPEQVTSFGIIIPDTTKEKSEEGIIVAVGPGKKNSEGKVIPVSFSVGERVRFSYGEEMKINGVEYVLVHEDTITAVINN
jgi:chaperonin GroES